MAKCRLTRLAWSDNLCLCDFSKKQNNFKYGVHKVTPVHCTMWEKKMFVTFQKDKKKGQGQNLQVLCTTSSSWLTVETMMEGQCQTVQ